MGLLNFFRKKNDKIEITEEGLNEVGVCPNCWGHSEYANEFVEYVYDREKDIASKNTATQKAFIEKFVEERITGIMLKNDNGVRVCPVCNSKK